MRSAAGIVEDAHSHRRTRAAGTTYRRRPLSRQLAGGMGGDSSGADPRVRALRAITDRRRIQAPGRSNDRPAGLASELRYDVGADHLALARWGDQRARALFTRLHCATPVSGTLDRGDPRCLICRAPGVVRGARGDATAPPRAAVGPTRGTRADDLAVFQTGDRAPARDR